MRGVGSLFRVSGGASISLAEASTSVCLDETRVSSYDLGGRPYVLVRDDWTYRRALDGRLLQKGRGRTGRVRQLLSAEAGRAVVEGARREVRGLLDRGLPSELQAATRAEAVRRLERIAAMDGAALEKDARRFAALYRPLGVLPPDQYLALVIQVTEGCSWNACTFCDLYRDTSFRVKTVAELDRHLEAVRAYFGEAIALRRSLFLADANALCLSHQRLLPLLDRVASAFPVAPADLLPRERYAWLREQPRGISGVHSFVDAWSGSRKDVSELRAYAARGLRRVYVGLETGDPDLLSWLGKPGSPEDAVELVSRLHQAGLSAGVIVLVGAGGERFFEAHVRETLRVLDRMRLGTGDLLYLSELVEHPHLEYARRASRPAPLSDERFEDQRRALLGGLRPADPAHPPRVARYDICEFVY
jgi:radical SAM superfamily enzyme YgiQ (UPF0313 family)